MPETAINEKVGVWAVLPYFSWLTYFVFHFLGTVSFLHPLWQTIVSLWNFQSRHPLRPRNTQTGRRAWSPHSPDTWQIKLFQLAPMQKLSRLYDGFVFEAKRAHSDKGAVITPLLLFSAERLDLCLEVGRPRFAGKHKLWQKQKWWLN